MKPGGELLERNLALFQYREPALYEQLKVFRPEAELVTTESGQVDLSVGGDLFFGGRHDATIDEVLENYWRNPGRIALTPPIAEQGDDEAGQFIGGLLQRLDEAGMAPGEGLVQSEGYFLILLGLGLGAHIDRMVQRSGCQTLLLVEPVLEFIYHSLSTYDWAALFESFAASGRTLHIISDPDPVKISAAIKWRLRESNVCGLDGAYYLKFYDMPVIDEVLAGLGNELIAVSNGLGCYLDERLMVRNAHDNLKSGQSRLYRSPGDRQLDIPVFLVGSGPSLDDAISVIKDNRDKAVIVSVGTALQPLLNNAIVPDFQVESENFYPDFDAIMEFLQGAPETENIHLVAAVTCPREFINSYGSASLYFRDAQTPTQLFKPPPGATLIGGSPAVGNAGLSFIQWAGFRTFYLFGMDMGARQPERHHAAGSLGLVNEEFNIEVPGNFGGRAYTTSVFYEMLVSINESIINFSQGRRYFNCSDGCQVRGTEPLRPNEVTIDSPRTPKSETVRQLVDETDSFTHNEVEARWRECDLANEVARLTEQANEIVAGTLDFSDHGHLKDIFALLVEEKNADRMAAQTLIRGSIFNMIIAVRYFSNRLGDPEHKQRFHDAVQATFAESMERLQRRCASDMEPLANS